MKSMSLPVPGLVFGPYPERVVGEPLPISGLSAFGVPTVARRYRRNVELSLQRCEQLLGLPTAKIDSLLTQLRANISRYGLLDEHVVEAFAIISCVSDRTLGMRPYFTQLMAARVMLDNRLAEMATGEGKTLAVGVCAATAGIAGIPVHVITSNDYLVARDTEKMRPLLNALGVSVDCVTQDMKREARVRAYGADVTYCTAKELVFDYLRDAMIRNGDRSDLRSRVKQLSAGVCQTRTTLLRGLCLAIVDEADSILLDEARVPLILSRQLNDNDKGEKFQRAFAIATELEVGADYRLDRTRRVAELTPSGTKSVEKLAAQCGLRVRNRMHRNELVCQALSAMHLYHRDHHYIVKDGVVVIVDEMTGRVSPGRRWSRGLHQLIEYKEGVDSTGEQVTARQITYQRFFRKYLSLGGTSGTIREANSELRAVYGLEVIKVPLLRPDNRKLLPTRLFSGREAMWTAVVKEAARLQHLGQPVLIGTDSVAESESLSAMLTVANVTHKILNARQDGEEAQVVANAGLVGSVTVATNMAGRGTDIPLGAGVAERGGLHVISCQHNTSRRIDRQLIGRCARQGDPGSAQAFICRDQSLIRRSIPAWITRFLATDAGCSRPKFLVEAVRRWPQMLEENRQRAQRHAMLVQDMKLDRALASADGLE